MLTNHVYIIIPLFSILAGMIVGIFGGGSGLILMPTYYFALKYFPLAQDLKMQMAIATTALSTSICALPSLYQHIIFKNVEIYLIKRLLPGMLIGTLLAVIFLNIIPSSYLKLLFGFFVITVSIWLFLYDKDSDSNKWSISSNKNFIISIIISFLWFSFGVAVFTVPYLIKCQVKLITAIGTATFISISMGFIISIMLIITGYYHIGLSLNHIGFVNITFLSLTIFPAILGSYLGTKICFHINPSYLKISYASLVLVVGLLMIF